MMSQRGRCQLYHVLEGGASYCHQDRPGEDRRQITPRLLPIAEEVNPKIRKCQIGILGNWVMISCEIKSGECVTNSRTRDTNHKISISGLLWNSSSGFLFFRRLTVGNRCCWTALGFTFSTKRPVRASRTLVCGFFGTASPL